MDEAVTPSPRKQGWPVVVASVVAVITAMGFGVFMAARTPVESSASARTHEPTIPQHMNASISELGILFSTESTFPGAVTLSAPVVSAGEVEAVGELWPLDGLDHEGEDLEPLLLSAGTPVQIQGLIRPPCDGRDIEVIIAVISQKSDGETSLNRYAARNADALAAATRQYCRQGPTVNAAMNLLYPNGDAVIGVNVMNPGPAEIKVEVPGYADEHVTWTAIAGTVQAGESVRFEIHGSQVGCEPGEEASWEDGRLLLDGTPFVVTSDDGWC